MPPVKDVIIFGAHGLIGQQLIKLISQKPPLKATAVVRNETQAQAIANSNVTTTYLTLDQASVADISQVIKGHDAVVITVGSRGKNLLQVDLDGVVKTFEASVDAKVRRLVLISAVRAENREYIDNSSIRDYYIAKHYADRILINEFGHKLDYTIVKPSALTNDGATGKIKVLSDTDDNLGKIARADVAQSLLDVLDLEETFGRSYNITGGDEPIDDPSTWK
ncbi:uncharacterized protein LODBEIA_P10430 [Lodderomyces beijingensis]|uniref:NAD(P)-binding domain-containing protein n=1 Tax=Lodderomyces beijingensis TaxID=1775926 RepID=A0ABP0ZF83_9ASCO